MKRSSALNGRIEVILKAAGDVELGLSSCKTGKVYSCISQVEGTKLRRVGDGLGSSVDYGKGFELRNGYPESWYIYAKKL